MCLIFGYTVTGYSGIAATQQRRRTGTNNSHMNFVKLNDMVRSSKVKVFP